MIKNFENKISHRGVQEQDGSQVLSAGNTHIDVNVENLGGPLLFTLSRPQPESQKTLQKSGSYMKNMNQKLNNIEKLK